MVDWTVAQMMESEWISENFTFFLISEISLHIYEMCVYLLYARGKNCKIVFLS